MFGELTAVDAATNNIRQELPKTVNKSGPEQCRMAWDVSSVLQW